MAVATHGAVRIASAASSEDTPRGSGLVDLDRASGKERPVMVLSPRP